MVVAAANGMHNDKLAVRNIVLESEERLEEGVTVVHSANDSSVESRLSIAILHMSMKLKMLLYVVPMVRDSHEGTSPSSHSTSCAVRPKSAFGRELQQRCAHLP